MKNFLIKNLTTFVVAFVPYLIITTTLSAQEPPPKIKIGVIMDLSGEYISISNEMRKGFEIAINEKYNVPFELIYETDQGFSSSGAVKAFHRLLQKKVDVVLNWAYTTLPAIAPIATKSKIPVLAFWDSNKGILKMGDYIYGSGNPAEETAYSGAEFLVKKLSNSSIGIIALQDAFAEISKNSFKDKALELGAKIVLDEVVLPTSTDLRATALRIPKSNAQALYICSYGASLLSLLKEIKNLNYQGQILCCDGFLDQDIETLGKEVSEGLYGMQTVANNTNFVEKFLKLSDQKDKTLTQIGYAGLAYDGLKILSNILESINSKGEKITSESIKNSMKGYVHDGVTGRAVLGGKSQKVEKIVVVKGGRFEEVH